MCLSLFLHKWYPWKGGEGSPRLTLKRNIKFMEKTRSAKTGRGTAVEGKRGRPKRTRPLFRCNYRQTYMHMSAPSNLIITTSVLICQASFKITRELTRSCRKDYLFGYWHGRLVTGDCDVLFLERKFLFNSPLKKNQITKQIYIFIHRDECKIT